MSVLGDICEQLENEANTLRAQLEVAQEKLAVLSESHASMSMALDSAEKERDELRAKVEAVKAAWSRPMGLITDYARAYGWLSSDIAKALNTKAKP